MNSPENLLMSEILSARNNILHPEHNYYIDLITKELTFAGEILSRNSNTVTAFGSARTHSDSPEYARAVACGKITAQYGYTSITGGGPGIMEAFSKGAYQNNGKVLGFSIKLPNEQASNDFIHHNITFNYFFSRKYAMMAHSNIFLYFPGGYGTLDELFEALTMIQTKKFLNKEIILIGRDFWEPLVGFIKDKLQNQDEYISPFDNELFRIIDEPSELETIFQYYKA